MHNFLANASVLFTFISGFLLWVALSFVIIVLCILVYLLLKVTLRKYSRVVIGA